MQMHFVAALSQFLLAPLLWSFWLVLLGLPHPMDAVVDRNFMWAAGALFIGIEAMSVATGVIAVSGPAHRHLLPWVPTLHFYWPLGTLAAYKALWELIHDPFYWDKTSHGMAQGQSAGVNGASALPQSFQRSGIELQPRDERLRDM
jgi:hypothetical protein